ncbi:MAG: CNNM domain-containing protein [Christensenellaceae bacterium]|jgi:hypothetical protein|nr:CNNM domain-containing protein [Christensenellaceae bacterium]
MTEKKPTTQKNDNMDSRDPLPINHAELEQSDIVSTNEFVSKPEKIDQHTKQKKHLSKITVWTIKITIVTFILSCFFSYISEITTSNTHLAISFLLLIFLICVNIIFDAISVATTACELAPLLSMASRKIKGSKTAVKLVKNSERVSNICGDVIGDICGIISGACTAAIVLKVIEIGDFKSGEFLISIIGSAIVAALTVGGKAIFKEVAVKNSKEIVMFVAKLINLVSHRG